MARGRGDTGIAEEEAETLCFTEQLLVNDELFVDGQIYNTAQLCVTDQR